MGRRPAKHWALRALGSRATSVLVPDSLSTMLMTVTTELHSCLVCSNMTSGQAATPLFWVLSPCKCQKKLLGIDIYGYQRLHQVRTVKKTKNYDRVTKTGG